MTAFPSLEFVAKKTATNQSTTKLLNMAALSASMNMISHIKSTPLWLVPLLFFTTLAIGIYAGTPIAVGYYELGAPSEVSQLFVLMPVVYFWVYIPLCLLCTFGLKVVRSKVSKVACAVYVSLCVIAVPTVFYGTSVSIYYG